MFTNDVDVPKEELRNAIVQELRLLGMRQEYIPKKSSKQHQVSKTQNGHGCVFRKQLHLLSSRVVQLQSGVEAEVPNIIQEICHSVLCEADTEGLFRKAGSAARQRELKTLLDQGRKVQFSQHHVIDVANILKLVLRELPEPVLPFAYHDLFLNCLMSEDVVGATLLACLLLPRTHLHVLAYLMEFFHVVAGRSHSNKMTAHNLAIVMAPTLVPDKAPLVHNAQRINGQVRIVEILIGNADKIGVLPDAVVGKLTLTPSVSNISLLKDDHTSGTAFSVKKKRRRSGSLTRMFNGLKKIVAGKPSPGADTDYFEIEEETNLVPSTSDFSTPCVKAAKKRKASETTPAFTNKKKREVLMALPQSTALADTPFKKHSGSVSEGSETPQVCAHPNPPTGLKQISKSPQKPKTRKFLTSRTFSESDDQRMSTTKILLGANNFLSKKQKQRSERHSSSGNFLERSWSAVSSSNWGRKKFRQSDHTRLSAASTSTVYVPFESDSSHDADVGIDLSQEEDVFHNSPSDFVQVPKSEYEDLKCRMSAIESCISKEFSSVSNAESISSPENISAANTILAVQNVYEKTLEDANIAQDTSTDQLAKRLSRELKIRRSSDSKVIRSPSARKIGSLRRRSHTERRSPSLRRNRSWHMMPQSVRVSPRPATVLSIEALSAPGSRLRRGRPNTVNSGLPQPTPNRVTKAFRSDDIIPILGANLCPVTRSQTRRASFNGSETSSPTFPFSKKCRSQVNLAKAALLAHAQQKNSGSIELHEKWRDAQELFSSSTDGLSCAVTTGRESIAKLRSENAGKVLATAKLFSSRSSATKPIEVKQLKANEEIKATLRNTEEDLTSKSKQRCDHNSQDSRTKDRPFQLNLPSSKVRAEHSSSSFKKSASERSPAVSVSSRKLRGKISPTMSPNVRNTNNKVKKHSSMKAVRVVHTQPVKRNLSVPVQWVDTGKENQVSEPVHAAPQLSRGLSPQRVKEPVPSTDRILRVSVSPLKDCNRIPGHSLTSKTMKIPAPAPCSTPTIKPPLTVLTPRRKAFTPQTNRGTSANTPLKVTASLTPSQSAKCISSRPNSNKAFVKIVRSCK